MSTPAARLLVLLSFLLSSLLCSVAPAQQPGQTLPTPAQVRNRQQPPGMDVLRPGRTPGEKPSRSLRGERQLDTPDAPSQPDRSVEASPVEPGVPVESGVSASGGLRLGAKIAVQIAADVSSGRQHNGDLVEGTLSEPIRLPNGRVLAQGSPVTATVVSSAHAGTIQSGGVLSLELVRVGALPVVTDILAFDGQEGHKDVADSAPEKGTEATVAAGTVLVFHVTS